MTHPDLSKIPSFQWLPRARDFCDIQGIDPTHVEAAARQPTHVTVDPSVKLAKALGQERWPAERRRRGDITVVVAYPPGDYPVIWGVFYQLPLPPLRDKRSQGAGGGTVIPTTMRELRRRIIAAGLVIKSGGRHDRVETPDGRFIYSLSISPSDHRYFKNVVSELARKGFDVTR